MAASSAGSGPACCRPRGLRGSGLGRGAGPAAALGEAWAGCPGWLIVTGIDGFAGSHLADLLLRRRHIVHGTIRGDRPALRAELAPRVQTHPVDLLDRDRVETLVREIQPQWVFHLGAHREEAAR